MEFGVGLQSFGLGGGISGPPGPHLTSRRGVKILINLLIFLNCLYGGFGPSKTRYPNRLDPARVTVLS